MGIYDLALTRQSVRAFTDEPVSRNDIMTCLKTARIAPSACNSQPWKFVVADDPEVLKKVALAITDNGIGINQFANTAPTLIAVVEEEALLIRKGGKAPNDKWARFDLGHTTELFCLQAAELGLGTCIMGAFNEEKMHEALNIPKDRRICVMLAVGHPSGTIREKTRNNLETIYSFNTYED